MALTLEPFPESRLDYRGLGGRLTPAYLAGSRGQLERVRQLARDSRRHLDEFGSLGHYLPRYRVCGQAVDIATVLQW
jgi:hypothetical protein